MRNGLEWDGVAEIQGMEWKWLEDDMTVVVRRRMETENKCEHNLEVRMLQDLIWEEIGPVVVA